ICRAAAKRACCTTPTKVSPARCSRRWSVRGLVRIACATSWTSGHPPASSFSTTCRTCRSKPRAGASGDGSPRGMGARPFPAGSSWDVRRGAVLPFGAEPAARRGAGPLLTHPVVPLGLLHEALLVLGRQLRTVDGQRQLVELAGELERHLVVLVVHRCAGVGADVEGLVPLEDERDRVVHLLGAHDLAVDLEHSGAGLADAAQVVEGEGRDAEAVVLEVELERVLARR